MLPTKSSVCTESSPASSDLPSVEVLQRRFARERASRHEAERLLEKKSLELFEANARMKDLAERTRAIVDTAAEGIISYGPDGTIEAFNRSAARIFHCESAVGRNIAEFFKLTPELEEALFQTSCTTVGNGGEQDMCIAEPMEAVAIRNFSDEFSAEVAASKIVHGDAILLTALVRDLSRRKLLESRLARAQKMESVGQLAAGIAHEINTPIQFVGDNMQFLQGAFEDLAALIDSFESLRRAVVDGQPTDELLAQLDKQREIADIDFLREEFPAAMNQSIEGIERVACIVRSMKEFAQPASTNKSSVNINQAIENAVAVASGQRKEAVDVRLNLDPALRPVVCLAGQINESLMNILLNAYEAVAESKSDKGAIEISTRNIPDAVEIKVVDNGCGIAEEILDKIFEPFFTTKEVGRGTGQGLAFVYDTIVMKHDGRIHAKSTLGRGTTIHIQLPTAS